MDRREQPTSVNFVEFFKKSKKIKLQDGELLELELRLLIDSRTKSKGQTFSKDATINYAKTLIEKYKENETEIEQTINIFAADEQTFKQLLFINGEKKKDHEVVRQKIRLINPVFMNKEGYFSYKLTASIEKPIDQFDMTRVSFTRVKLRYSVDLNEDWRLDITLTKTLQNVGTNPGPVKDAKQKMFFPINKTNFVDQAPWHEADTIEFELEYIGPLEKLSIDSLRIADRFNPNSIDEVDDNDETDTISTNIQPYQEGLVEIATRLQHKRPDLFKKKFGLKQLSNQVIELNKNTFMRDVLPDITKYYITDKVDGQRNMLYLSASKAFAVSSSYKELPIREMANFSGPAAANSSGSLVCIIDCEEYEGKYYIFDVLYYGEPLTDQPFEVRMSYFKKAVTHWKALQLKPFELLTDDFQEQIKNFKKRKVPYETDGLVLTPQDEKYFNMRCYKYKPITHLTIDFFIRDCPEGILGVKPFVEKDEVRPMLLFCGMPKNVFLNLNLSFVEKYEYLFPWVDKRQLPDYFPYQFQPCDSTFPYLFWPTEKELSLSETKSEGTKSEGTKFEGNKLKEITKHSPLDGMIGEFIYDLSDSSWRLQRLRLDRMGDLKRRTYFGNAYKIAEQNWFAYKNPLEIESLPLDSKALYFGDKDTGLQKNSRNFNSFVKSKVFDRLRDAEWVLDMASGNGQDLFRYADHRVKNVLFTEVDKTAIEELVSRRNQFAEKPHTVRATRMLVSQLDFLEDYRKAIQKIDTDHIILPEKFNTIVCNFAFHYFAKSSETLDNAIRFANSMLKVGGQIIFTAYDGRKVIKLLNDHNGDYKVYFSGDYKVYASDDTSAEKQIYGIRATGPSDGKTNFVSEIPGQQIEVLLPFSGGQYYKEYLITEKIAEEAFNRNGFLKVSIESFKDFIPNYKNVLEDVDKEYVSLYSIYTFKKKEAKYETFERPAESPQKKSGRKSKATK